jgi:hypothetical protein
MSCVPHRPVRDNQQGEENTAEEKRERGNNDKPANAQKEP